MPIAESPLLEKPLEGPVLIRSSVHRLPDLVIALRGQVRVDLVAQVSSVHERLRASFKALPDVPISRVRLDLKGGKRGLLENSENLCQEPQSARVRMVGQNDKVHIVSVPAGAECQRGSRSAALTSWLPFPCGRANREYRGCTSCQADPSGLPFVEPGAGCAARAGPSPDPGRSASRSASSRRPSTASALNSAA